MLVDGYNVAKLGWPSLDLGAQREQCIEAAENLASGGTWIITSCSTAPMSWARTPRRGVGCGSSYSPAGVIADDVLRSRGRALDPVGRWSWSPTTRRSSPTCAPTGRQRRLASDSFLTARPPLIPVADRNCCHTPLSS